MLRKFRQRMLSTILPFLYIFRIFVSSMKSLYILLICYAVSFSSFSQGWVLEESDITDRSDNDMETEMEIGVEGGPALTTSWGHQYKVQMEGQYYVGVYYRAQFEPWFGFQV